MEKYTREDYLIDVLKGRWEYWTYTGVSVPELCTRSFEFAKDRVQFVNRLKEMIDPKFIADK